MRAKFRCNSVQDFGNSYVQANLSAVTDDGTPENERYHTATPSGTLSINISNPDVRGFLVPEHYYFLDFTEA
jgi:hypothetical protein